MIELQIDTSRRMIAEERNIRSYSRGRRERVAGDGERKMKEDREVRGARKDT
jgi:hypothetical protein